MASGFDCCCNVAENLNKDKLVQQITQLNSSLKELQKTLNQVLPFLPQLQNLVLPPNTSSLPHQVESSASRNFELCFKGYIPDELLTKNKIEDEGASLEVELLDEFGKRVEVGPDSCATIKFDVLDGDFEVDDGNYWTEEDFIKNVARPRKDRGSLLKGKNKVSLSGGAARVRGISFTDNSKSITTNGWVRLGAQVTAGLPSGGFVRSAVSKAFQVKENRLKSDRKHQTPSLEDDLWRLKNINKTGAVYRRALDKNVRTVRDFLQLLHTDEKKMQDILLVKGTKWDEIVQNAEACKLTNKRYRYYDVASGDDLILDCVFNIEKVTFMGQTSQIYASLDSSQKEKAGKLRQAAYEKRNVLESFDDSTNQVSVQSGFPGHTHPFCVQLQELEEQEQQPAAALPPSVSGLWGSMDTNLSSESLGIKSPLQYPETTVPDQDNLQQNTKSTTPALFSAGVSGGNNLSLPDENLPLHLSDYRPESQILSPPETVGPALYQTPSMQFYQGKPMEHVNGFTRLESFFLEDGWHLEALLEDTNWDPLSKGFSSSTQQEERDDVPDVSRLPTHKHVTSKLIAACYVTKAAAMFMLSVQQDVNVLKKKRKRQ